MERYGYTLHEAKAESTELLYLMECASYGRHQDEQELMERRETEWEQQRTEMESNGQ